MRRPFGSNNPHTKVVEPANMRTRRLNEPQHISRDTTLIHTQAFCPESFSISGAQLKPSLLIWNEHFRWQLGTLVISVVIGDCQEKNNNILSNIHNGLI